VVEVIFNNRTAFAFNTKLESPNATQIALFVSGSSLIRVRRMLSRTPYTGRRCNPLMMLSNALLLLHIIIGRVWAPG
jgi:hypothetical protein